MKGRSNTKQRLKTKGKQMIKWGQGKNKTNKNKSEPNKLKNNKTIHKCIERWHFKPVLGSHKKGRAPPTDYG
jgi:hypothetical protein